MASDLEHLLFLINALGLSDRVRLSGPLPLEEVRNRLRRSDVLLHPSHSEGIANSVLEAMACALPVVVTDVGGMREAVGDGVEGLVCPPRDPRSLAEALRQVWQSPELAWKLGEAGRARVLADFLIATEIEELAAFYQDLSAAAPTRLDGQTVRAGSGRFVTESAEGAERAGL